MYCLKCKEHTKNSDEKTVSSGGRMMMKASCNQCGGAKSQFMKKQKGKGLGLAAANLFRKTACGGKARPLLPGERHVGCSNWAGPGTVINDQTRNTPPYDAVDAVAKVHDFAYEKAFKMSDPAEKKKAIRAADEAMVSALKSKGLQNTLAAKAIGVKMSLENSGKVGQAVIKTVVGKDYTGKGRRRR